MNGTAGDGSKSQVVPPKSSELDVGRLEGWLDAHVDGFKGPLTVERFASGQSNPTYLLETPTERYVLRRKPSGALQQSAHAIDREYRVIGALAAEGSVPVPRAIALCRDDAVIGTWFYIMSWVDGRLFWDPRLPTVPRHDRRPYAESIVDALARLHSVDVTAAGLADFGRPNGYLARQVARWSRQYAADEGAGRVPVLESLMEWLSANLPSGEESAIIHGDYRLDNLLFAPRVPRVQAVLDWELATIGHPLADLAYYLMVYRLPSLAVPGLLGVDTAAEGLPSEIELVELYRQRTGRERVPNLGYFTAFSLFRLAAIYHGIRARVIRGTAAGDRAQEYARHVELIAGLGWKQALTGNV